MINISNCPDTGLKRKVTSRDFMLFEEARQIVLKCNISHYKVVDNEDVLVNNARTHNYSKPLVASDSLVDAQTGRIWTDLEVINYKTIKKAIEDYPALNAKYEKDVAAYNLNNSLPIPIAPVLPQAPIEPMFEYDFFTMVIGGQPIMFFQLLDNIIAQRDLQGKFNI